MISSSSESESDDDDTKKKSKRGRKKSKKKKYSKRNNQDVLYHSKKSFINVNIIKILLGIPYLWSSVQKENHFKEKPEKRYWDGVP